ncbi:MAG: major facilitator superfamily 1 [Mucilaginibacter sp.]|jgi:MFS family permease|nr:major facilitator superfamily 1 [Mucilaginibacter sp.]
MNFSPSETLTDAQVDKGLKLVVTEGLMAEAMVVFTSGAFLVALAVHMGVSNFQLGLLAALPTFTSIFQLVSISLIQRFNNRKIVTAGFNFLARIPVITIGILPFVFSGSTSFEVLLMLLLFQHICGDIAGASWNGWMKDLIPGERLGSYFSHRIRLAQILNVTLSVIVAFGIDYIKVHYPAKEILTYNLLFLIGGILGMMSVVLLLRTPEPKPVIMDQNLFKMLGNPLKNKNFRSLVIFNSFWAFALNLATPFFTVFMLKTLALPLSYIIGLGILGQLSGIASIKLWGKYSDRFSNKTIIGICAPLYIACILTFAFVDLSSAKSFTIVLLILIYTVSGLSSAGINLALANIGMKLAPKKEAIAYISAKNMCVAFFSTIAPIVGGLMADFFATHPFVWNLHWDIAGNFTSFRIIDLQGWNYFFIIGGLLALISLKFLAKVDEEGEINKKMFTRHVRFRMHKSLRNNIGISAANIIVHPVVVVKRNINSFRAKN